MWEIWRDHPLHPIFCLSFWQSVSEASVGRFRNTLVKASLHDNKYNRSASRSFLLRLKVFHLLMLLVQPVYLITLFIGHNVFSKSGTRIPVKKREFKPGYLEEVMAFQNWSWFHLSVFCSCCCTWSWNPSSPLSISIWFYRHRGCCRNYECNRHKCSSSSLIPEYQSFYRHVTLANAFLDRVM